MSGFTVSIKTLLHADGLALPAYATEHAAGMDLLAAIADDLVIAPGQRVLVPTGIALALPQGYEAQVRPALGPCFKTWPNRPEQSRHDRCRLSRRSSGYSC